MTLEKINVVDAAGIDKVTGGVVLSIVDAWEWHDELAHLSALQAKFNAYFDFIESGQIYEAHPEAVRKGVHLTVIHRFPMPASAKELLLAASKVAGGLGVSISQRLYRGAN